MTMKPFPPHPARAGAPARRQQSGVATLLVVMALFFLVSMVAAYTSRNLVFEQRTSANQYRATQAFEVAEGGIEWAISLLNSGRVDGGCAATVDGAQASFRSRYLNIDTARGLVDPPPLASACVRTQAGWDCSCPDAAEPVLADPGGLGIRPAFRVTLQPDRTTPGSPTPGVFLIESTACTSSSDSCLRGGRTDAGEANARISATVALVPGLAAPPSAAVTVRDALQITGVTPMNVVNEDTGTNGMAVQAGRAVGGAINTFSVPGTPPGEAVVENDATLRDLDVNRMFLQFFGMSAPAFRRQPAAVRFPDGDGACRDSIAACVAAHPGRPVWVEGDLSVDGTVQLGSPATPVLLVVDGQVRLASAGASIVGIVYSRAATLSDLGSGSILGALISEGSIVSPSAPDVRYDRDVINRIRFAQGAVVRLPGGWKDF